jgi:adenine-specific DNA methylase
MTQYRKRLIEVDLPVKKISEHARHEKNFAWTMPKNVN